MSKIFLCHRFHRYRPQNSLWNFCFEGRHHDNVHMLQYSIVHFFYMSNLLSKEFLKKVCTCNVQTWANQLVQQVALYIRDDTNHYRGPSPTLKYQSRKIHISSWKSHILNFFILNFFILHFLKSLTWTVLSNMILSLA